MATERITRGAGGAAALVLAVAAVALLALTGQLTLVSAVLTLLVCVVAAAVTAWRSFAVFICGAIVVRPLLDLTAGPRSAGVSPTDVFGGAVLLVSLAWLWFNRHALAQRLGTGLTQAQLALLAAMTLSAFGAPTITSAAQVVLRVTTGVAIFLVLDLLLHRGTLTVGRLLVTLATAYVVPLLFPVLGLVGVPVFHEKDGVTALKSVFYLSNNYGHFLVPLVIVAAAWFVRARGRYRLVAGAVLAVAGVELLGTQTRGAWFAAFVGVVCVGLLLSRRFLLGAATVAVLVVLFVPAVNSRLTSLEPDSAKPRTESSLAWRFGHWETLMPLALEEPLIGLGPDESVLLTGKEPHNDYVRALVETGVLGFAAYLWFLGALVATAARALRRVGGTPLDRWLGPVPGAPPLTAGPLTQATVAGLGAYTIGVALASIAENLIDNLTFLSVLMPCAAILVHVAQAQDRASVDPREAPRVGQRSAPLPLARPEPVAAPPAGPPVP